MARRAHFGFFAAAAAVPLVVFAALALRLLDLRERSEVEDRLRNAARSAIAATDLHLAAQNAALGALEPDVDSDTLRRDARKLLARHPDWTRVSLLEPDGTPVLSEPPADAAEPGRPAPGGAPLARAAIETGSREAGPAGRVSVELFVPVEGAGRRFVVAAKLRPEPFSSLLGRLPVPDGWTLAILDASQVIVGRSRAQADYIGTHATPSLTAEIRKAADNVFFSFTKEGGRVYTAFSTSLRTGWTAAAGAPASVIEAPARHSLALLLGAAAAALALALTAGALVLRSRERQHEAERRLLAVAAERRVEQRLADVAANFPGIIYRRVLHPDGRISFPYVSPGIATLIGEPDPATGPVTMEDFARRYIVPDDHAHWAESIRRSAATLAPFDEIGRLCRANGEIRWVRSVARTRRESDGSIVWDGVTLDITHVKEAEAALRRALEERETLLQEIHHRVKNNLQVILSLVRMETTRTGSSAERERLQAISHRIEILARIHEQLYGSKNFVEIDLMEELKQLCRSVSALHHGRGVSIEVVGDPEQRLACPIDLAIPLALLVNELVTNSLKHAFPAGRGGAVTVSVRREPEGGFSLAVADDGAGFRDSEAGGTGRRLVAGLAAQIRATLRTESNGGTRVTVTVPPAEADRAEAPAG